MSRPSSDARLPDSGGPSGSRLRLKPWWRAAALGALASSCASLGGRPSSEDELRLQRSPHYDAVKQVFLNPIPTEIIRPGSTLSLISDWVMGATTKPAPVPPVASIEPDRLRLAPATGMRATWLGHATVLIELDGYRLLTDPIWSDRASPVPWAGARRAHPPPIALRDLPSIDAVVISHDHYDHLDLETVLALSERGVMFFVPLGVGAHLRRWGVAPQQIREHDWWEEARIGRLRVVATPARHHSGRALTDGFRTQWAGWAIIGDAQRVFFGGDTGLFPGLSEIAARLGPFDLTLLDVGDYDPRWGDIHLGPEGAVAAHRLLSGGLLLPIHWGTFTNGHGSRGWSVPMDQLVALAASSGTRIVTPRPGQSFEPSGPLPPTGWWRGSQDEARGDAEHPPL